MEKEFVNYELALELKELGFDEPCICGYSTSNEKLEIYSRFLVTKDSFTIDAPTFQQAFRWFREKYELNFQELIFRTIGGKYGLQSYNEHDQVDGYFESYEEAELECLKKLIEIVKNK